jgi:hypothetical protein
LIFEKPGVYQDRRNSVRTKKRNEPTAAILAGMSGATASLQKNAEYRSFAARTPAWKEWMSKPSTNMRHPHAAIRAA